MKKNLILSSFLMIVSVISMYSMERGNPEEMPYGFLQNLAAAGANMPQDTQPDPVTDGLQDAGERNMLDSLFAGFFQNSAAAASSMPQDTQPDPVTDGLQYANAPCAEPAVQDDPPCGGYTPGTEPAGRHLSHSSSEPSVRNGERHLQDSLLALIGPERPSDALWDRLDRLNDIRMIIEVLLEVRTSNSTLDKEYDPNQPNLEGMLPLVFAITQLQDSNVVSSLLKCGANPNPEVSVSPLHHAVLVGQVAIVEVLLKGGANPRVIDQREQTPADLIRSHQGGSSFIGPEKQQARERILTLLVRAATKARKAERKPRGSIAFPTLRRSRGAARKK